MAAGMGSRYGGLKQMVAFGPSGETILEYAVFDAIRSGFSKVVFIIRKEFEQDFRDKVVSRFADKIAVELAFQELSDLPGEYTVPADRSKPWGTGHAVWVARELLDKPFAVMNADDFYGKECFAALAGEMIGWDVNDPPKPVPSCMAAFPLAKTLSAHGTVSRGICAVSEDGILEGIEEVGNLSTGADGPVVADGEGKGRRWPADQPVSMNAFGFHPQFLPLLEEGLLAYLNTMEDPLKGEYYLPSACTRFLCEGKLRRKGLHTDSSWLGVTYTEDTEGVRSALRFMIDQGDYPAALWES
jgi:hypothetical protein